MLRPVSQGTDELGVLPEADRLDVVAIRIDQKRGVVVGSIVCSDARTSLVSPAGLQSDFMKPVNGSAFRRSERHVDSRTGFPLGEVDPKARLTGRTKACAGFVLGVEDVSEDSQNSAIEANAGLDGNNLQANVVVHGISPARALIAPARPGHPKTGCHPYDLARSFPVPC